MVPCVHALYTAPCHAHIQIILVIRIVLSEDGYDAQVCVCVCEHEHLQDVCVCACQMSPQHTPVPSLLAEQHIKITFTAGAPVSRAGPSPAFMYTCRHDADPSPPPAPHQGPPARDAELCAGAKAGVRGNLTSEQS